MPLSEEFLLLLLLVLLAASLAGAFARLLRLPAVPVYLLFGGLLAHGPGAVFGATAAPTLQPVVVVALAVVALGVGARCRPAERAPAGVTAHLRRHLFAEVALVPLLVWLTITVFGGVPPAVALVVGLLALVSAADVLEALARRPGGADLFRAPADVARADTAAGLGLALGASWLLRLGDRGLVDADGVASPQPGGGPALPLLLLTLALGLSLTRSAPRATVLAAPLLGRAGQLALGVLGVVAGAVVAPEALPRGLFIATLVCSARLLGKLLAARWAVPRADSAPRGLRGATLGGALAPGSLLGVGVILAVRSEPALHDFRELFLAVGVWVAAINGTLGPLIARRLLLRATARRDALPLTPPRSAAGADGS